MKRLFSIVLVVVFLFHIAGTVILFKTQQLHIRCEIKQRIKNYLPENELCAIIQTEENKHLLEWEWGDEFRYQGKMYDVVKTTVDSFGHTIYHCIPDDKETILFAHLDEWVNKNIANNKSTHRAAENILQFFATTYPPIHHSSHFYQPEKTIPVVFTKSIYNCQLPAPLSPPPEWS